jgi:NTE family protein
MNPYLDNVKTQELLARASQLRSKVFSDIIDNQGNQYVDLVQEGGGVLGIALVGYTYILEKAGIRFYSLAGTSAGSINTLLIASMAPVGMAVSSQILDVLARQNLFDFVDGPKGIKKLLQKKIDGKKGIGWGIAWNALSIYRTLTKHLGLNPGDAFLDWLSKVINQNGIYTYADLEGRRKRLPELFNRLDHTSLHRPPKLALVTSEITTHTKADFPRMAGLYWKDVATVNPAEFARASMSIPFFFYPFERKNIPNGGSSSDEEWKKMASYNGDIPHNTKFVDGGMLSNFPIGIFHRSDGGMPSRPTFGARLSSYRQSYSKTDSITEMSGAMISTMRQIFDYDFILRNPDFKKLICNIDADAEFNWLNFNMSEARKVALFQLGAEKALEFLEKFNWEEYKQIRAQLATANRMAQVGGST